MKPKKGEHKPKCYRLDEETVEELDRLARSEQISFDKLFKMLIENYPNGKDNKG